MRCPRCRVENTEAAERCIRCGAPLALSENATPRPLGQTLQIDRREATPRPPPSKPAWEMTPPAEPARPRAVPPAPAAAQPMAGGARPTARQWPEPAATARQLAETMPAPAPGFEPHHAEGLTSEIPVHVEAIEIHLRRAPSWKRAAAWAVDSLVLGLFGVVLFRLAAGAAQGLDSSETGLDWAVDLVARNARLLAPLGAVMVLAWFVYVTLGHALMGATPGKWMLRIQVVARSGRPPTFARSALRSSLALAFLLVLGLGPLMAFFTRSGRALHDFVAGTYVVELP